MTNISFEEFYYTEDNQIHNLYEIQKEYEQNNGDISKYRGQMFCPECKKAELRFTHKTNKKRAYLSKIPLSEHAKDCIFKNGYASNSEIIQFVDNLSKEKVQDRLEATLNQLLPKKVKEGHDASNEFKDNPLIIEINNKKDTSIRKLIPKKSINSWFDKSEESKVFIFYGHVKLENKKVRTRDGICYELIVKTKQQNEWKKKTSIFRNRNKDDIDTERIYDIAVLGKIEFYKNFPQIKTLDFDYIKFR
ncbi:hypothetical protein [Kandleria sp.]|uniref:hypothetical protein n=1 Tax=Kandleria sp. TaxID=2774291 RepID=UPI001B5F35E1|nr:hypothetical protein [Kandleria sp.]MBP3277017.1 hypothetical protein [Kandleria sp.]